MHTDSTQNIPLIEPVFDGNEAAFLQDCLASGWLSSASECVTQFERAMAKTVGARHAVALQSGTAALHLALMLAGVHEGDEVIVPALTYVATANAVRYLGAYPVFVDVEAEYLQLDPQKLHDFLRENCRYLQGKWVNKVSRRPIRAVIAVHTLGHPCDVRRLREITRDYGIRIIEDCAESLGALYHGKPVGITGDVSTFSFNGNKILTTGGGGLLACGNAAWARRARHLSTQAKIDDWDSVHDEVAFNYRMSGLAAALGLAQLEKLVDKVAAKRRNAETYRLCLKVVPEVTPMKEARWAQASYWLYTVRLPKAASPRAIARRLAAEGIQTRGLWQPLSMSPAHEGAQSYQVEAAVSAYRHSLCLPSSPNLDEERIDRVVTALQEQLRQPKKARVAYSARQVYGSQPQQ